MKNKFNSADHVKKLINSLQGDLQEYKEQKDLWSQLMTDSHEDRQFMRDLTIEIKALQGLIYLNTHALESLQAN
jgi:hypothetical protein